jgi:SAM-dependent methyltransferase
VALLSHQRARLRRVLSRLRGSEPDPRTRLAERYLRGDGIELGALASPLPVSHGARVHFVDRLSVEELRAHYPELAGIELVEPNLLDDGETLTAISDASLDFVAASHFIEHTENPIGTLRNQLRKLRPGGVLFLVVPHKRATFDAPRAVTTTEHLLRDDREGPEWSRRAHYEEWVREANGVESDEVDATVERLLDQQYSIHFHVWTPAAFLDLLRYSADELALPFELLAFERNGAEFVIVLGKT